MEQSELIAYLRKYRKKISIEMYHNGDVAFTYNVAEMPDYTVKIPHGKAVATCIMDTTWDESSPEIIGNYFLDVKGLEMLVPHFWSLIRQRYVTDKNFAERIIEGLDELQIGETNEARYV